MGFLTAAFLEDQDAAAALVGVAAISDPHLRTEGDNLYIPSHNQLIAASMGLDSAVASYGYLVSPSLREMGVLHIAPFNHSTGADLLANEPPKVMDLRTRPVILTPGEQLEHYQLSNPAAAYSQWCVLWLADGPVRPVEGPMHTRRLTGAITLTAQAWTNGNLTLDEDLPAGRYAIVGMKASGASLVAARIVPRGGGPRPGVLAGTVAETLDHPMFRHGQMGVFTEFVHDNLPSFDFLGNAADTAQVVYLDLQKIG